MAKRLRTAVLVVHGMGSQRALETVRGVFNAVWFDNDDHYTGKKRIWSHPQLSGVDLDLTVATTNAIPNGNDVRSADFHELYWAHLMSETKAVAVLLWLFELGRKGPHFRTSMDGLWYCGATFLCLMLLSISLITLRAITWLSEIVGESHGILITLFIMVAVGMLVAMVRTPFNGWWRLSSRLAIGFVLWCFVGFLAFGLAYLTARWANWLEPTWKWTVDISAPLLTGAFLPIGLALVATLLLMGKQGAKMFGVTMILSLSFFAIYMLLAYYGCFGDGENIHKVIHDGRLPWSLYSKWSAVAAWIIIGIYLIINAAFLQPYLGDAARYYRNAPANVAVRRKIRKDAVDTLDQLHRSRAYDRIIVVAHSLGTSVAYDMLRAYYGRICDQIPIDQKRLDPEFSAIDKGLLDGAAMRRQGREVIRKLAKASSLLAPKNRARKKPAESTEVDAWLVTDFVTVGSPLTHARYLVMNGKDADELDRDFRNRVRERELPTCPPQKLDQDGLIAFKNPGVGAQLHHGGMFGLTRWKNLYFPVKQIFWGDAIGGPLASTFGGYVDDIEVWPDKDKTLKVFTHTWYWKTDCDEKRDAPHIKALRAAIDLEDMPEKAKPSR